MALEVGNYISDLVATNPVGASDPKGQGDDHIRLLKLALKQSFPNITGPMNLTQAQINALNTKAGLEAILLAAFGTIAPQINTPSAATDWNTQLTAGWFATVESAGSANAPEAGSTWLGLNILAKDASNLVQIAIPDVPTTAQAKGIYIRSRVATVWSAWRHIIWETDIVTLITAINTAVLTFSNKILVDNTVAFADEGDLTKQLKFQLAGFTTATTRTLTPPNFDGTIATLAGAETLTNKTVKATTLANGGLAGGTAMTFSFAGIGGQPTWLWGTNDGATIQVYNPANFAVASATVATTATFAQQGGAPDFVIEDQQARNVAPQTYATNAWTQCRLNTEVRDPYGLLTLAANTFISTVNAWAEWECPGYGCETFTSRLWNITDGVVAGQGQTSRANGGGEQHVVTSIGGAPMIAGKSYQLEVYASGGPGGLVINIAGAIEVYNRLKAWRT